MVYFNPIFLIVILFCATFSIVFLCSLLDLCVEEICYRCCINRQNISTEIQPQHEPQQEDNIKESTNFKYIKESLLSIEDIRKCSVPNEELQSYEFTSRMIALPE